MFDELISQRLAQNFQLIVKQKESKTKVLEESLNQSGTRTEEKKKGKY